MSAENVKFLRGINRQDVKSLRQVIRNTEQRIGITKGMGFVQREKARRENEPARVCEEQASKNEIVKDLLERFFEASGFPDDELIKVAEWFVGTAEAAAKFKPSTDLYQKAVAAYGEVVEAHGSQLCLHLPKINWPKQRPKDLATDIPTVTPKATPETTPKTTPLKNVQFERGNHGGHDPIPSPSDSKYDIYEVPVSPKRGRWSSRYSTRGRKPSPRTGDKRRLPIGTPSGKNNVNSPHQTGMRKSKRLGNISRQNYKEEESDDDVHKEEDDPVGSGSDQHITMADRQYKRILSKGFMPSGNGEREWSYEIMWEDSKFSTWELVEKTRNRFPRAVEQFEKSMNTGGRYGPPTRKKSEKDADEV
ncbi:hypothetical protein DL98DRAFT_581044 [Cadophora sp. DSE1049]|nr:hypothetical protein DL98DRAFT_581044 [Cadophora sp. DSE1049]